MDMVCKGNLSVDIIFMLDLKMDYIDVLDFCRGPIPFQKPMYYVVGKPIEVMKNTSPTHAEVKTDVQFIVQLSSLFFLILYPIAIGRVGSKV